MVQGSITTEHIVWCSSCVGWDQICERTMSRTEKVAKGYGWRKIKGKWICPDCVQKKNY